MRIALTILLLVPLPPQEEPTVRRLIEQLADDDIRSREKAAAELLDLGRKAVPALQRLAVSGDIERQSRAVSILKRIAEEEVVRLHWKPGPRITLVSDGAPVASVLDDLERQANDRFTYDPMDLQEPVVLSVKNVSFWDAVEALCRAAPMLTWEGSGNALRFTRKERPAYPSKRQGEFLVWLDGITFNRDFDFTGQGRSAFTIQLAAAWEAGILPVAIDQRITEVLDENGTNLMPNDRFSSFGARVDVSGGRIRKDSAYAPFPPGVMSVRRFSKVKGYAAFYFPRSYQEVTFDLLATAIPVQVDRVTIAMHNFRILKDACVLELVLSSTTTGNEPMLDRLPSNDIVIVDDLGGEHRSPSSSRSHSYSGMSYTIHEHLQVPFPDGRTPKTLKLHVLKEVLEKRIPFEFEDIQVE
ncbi:MAG TPA: hypothetical protein VKW04_21915 [Planctomycetota bacterium]|nr:hypothetical protein [Planctomycetota bacterium]